MVRLSRRRWLAAAMALLLGLSLSVLAGLPGYAQLRPDRPSRMTAVTRLGVRLEQQPFYDELLAIRAEWQQHEIGQVVTDSPRGTVLNFYALMAEVAARCRAIEQTAATQPGWAWGSETKQRIQDVEDLFELTVGALDASPFPASVRQDMAHESALKLKQVLDYVFNFSNAPINLPNSSELKQLSESRSSANNSWRIPGTALTLTNKIENNPENSDFFFSAESTKRVEQMYNEISHIKVPANGFTTPDLYNNFSLTPGFLIPPLWYLKLPTSTRSFLEISYFNQTFLQIAASIVLIATSLSLGGYLAVLLIKTYRFRNGDLKQRLPTTEDDNIAWLRVVLVLPVLPLARFSQLFLDHYVNLTGRPLELVTYLFFIIWFAAASLLSFLTFEALGRSGAEWVMKLRGSNSQITLQRMNNLFMPICRGVGVLTSLFLLYELLIQLGLPSATVLAFSAVPGLAIGLGASKLLGNLFAGLSIQTDRPLRVGEFCKVGENTGFITRIGLRSLELQTLESRITIPNSVADEATIVNFSRRTHSAEATPSQGLDLNLMINDHLLPDQIDDLLHYTRRMLEADPDLQDPVVSIEQRSSDDLILICFGTVTLHGWKAYLQVRERILRRLQELLDVVNKSRIVIGVSYDTPEEKRRAIPELVRELVGSDADFSFRSCRLMAISEFSYDYVFDFRTSHSSYRKFKDAINRLNQDLLACFEAQGIEIPFPTQIEIQKD
jgi:MscS family membrane protein